MQVSEAEIRQQLIRGEDSAWEFKQVIFKGAQPAEPKRDDLADELIAFANAQGGVLLCGVTDQGEVQGMSKAEMSAVNQMLVELSTDLIKPALRINVYHKRLGGKNFVLVEIPRGDAVHERNGRAFIRVGASKRALESDERLRISQLRAQNRYLWYDKQVVPDTGFSTLCERLWEPMLSVAGASDPRAGLKNLGLLTLDETGQERATVAGILLCAESPENWYPNAMIIATRYRGTDRASEQLDAQEIGGPLTEQIATAVKFIVRNMRVAARKVPEREELPEYSSAAVFEAVVNAVAHRDYSIIARKIRISMFKGYLEIDSPGQLPNGMTIESMETSQATRNEVITSVFGRFPVGSTPGSSHRRFLMERRGDGVSIIKSHTQEVTGNSPKYKVINTSNLVLSIPAAKLELSPAESTVTVHCSGDPLDAVDVLALFPNKTWQRATTNESGDAVLDLFTTHLPMTVYVAAPGYSAGLIQDWLPNRGGLMVDLKPLSDGGSVIFPQASGTIPGLRGRLNPKRDSLDRTYMYADNIAIEEGRQQPVSFRLGKPMSLTDAFGSEKEVTVIDIFGRTALLEYRAENV